MPQVGISTYREQAEDRGLIDKVETPALVIVMIVSCVLGLGSGVYLGVAAGTLVGNLIGAFIAFVFLLSGLGAVAGGGIDLILRNSSDSSDSSDSGGVSTIVGIVLGTLLGLLLAVSIGAGGGAAMRLLASIALYGAVGAGVGAIFGGYLAYRGSARVDLWDILAGAFPLAGLFAVGGACIGAWAGFPNPDVTRFTTFTQTFFGIFLGMAGSAVGSGLGYVLAVGLNSYFRELSEGGPLLLHVAVLPLPAKSRPRYREEWRSAWASRSTWRRLPFLLDLLIRGVPQMAVTLRRKRGGGPGQGGAI